MGRKKQPAYTETRPRRATPLSLKRLKEIFDTEFGRPFLAQGTVVAKWRSDGTLNIQIGQRDIDLDEKGDVVRAGTNLGMPTAL